MGKIINDFHLKRLTNLLDTSGGQVVYGGRVNAEIRHIQPTIILNPKTDSPIMNEEIFGPILPIFVYKNLEEVITLINDRPKPLAVYYFGNPQNQDAIRIYNMTSSGSFMTNECIMQSVSHYQGFGGVGESGTGRYAGYEGFKNFSNRKGVLIKSPVPAFVREMLNPPFTDAKIATIEKVFFKASLYNQSDVARWFSYSAVGAVMIYAFYYFLTQM